MSKSVTIFVKRLNKQLKGNITILTLSNITGISRAAIYDICSKKSVPSLENAEKIAEALGYSLSEFVSDAPNSVHSLDDCMDAIRHALHNRAKK